MKFNRVARLNSILFGIVTLYGTACHIKPKSGGAIQTRDCGGDTSGECSARARVSGNSVVTREGVESTEKNGEDKASKKDSDIVLSDEEILKSLGGGKSDSDDSSGMSADEFKKKYPGVDAGETTIESPTDPTKTIPPLWTAKDYAYTEVIKPMMDNYCISCHDGSDSARANLNSYATAKSNAAIAYSLMSNGSMPKAGAASKDGATLSSQDILRFYAWTQKEFPLDKNASAPVDTPTQADEAPKVTFRIVWTGTAFEMQTKFDKLLGVSNAKYEYFKDSYKLEGHFDRATNQYVMDSLKVGMGFTFNLNNKKVCAAMITMEGPNGKEVTPQLDCSKDVSEGAEAAVSK